MIKTVCLFIFFMTSALFAEHEAEFFRASLNGDFETILNLYEKEGLRLAYAKDKDGNTPLHLACCSKKGGTKAEIVQFFVDHGVNINAYNRYKSTPLTLAIMNSNYEAVKLLLKAKDIRVNQAYQNRFTPLHLAVSMQAPELVSLLLTHPDTNPNFGTPDGATPLHYAAMQGFVDEARLIISDPRTDVNAPQHDAAYSGATPLHFAAMQAQAEIVALLTARPDIQINAVIDQGAHTGFTPLHFAVQNPDTINVFETVKILLENGADPRIKCEAGKTPLDLTAVSIIQKTLKKTKSKKS